MSDLAALQRAFHDAMTGATPIASARELVREDGVDPIRRLRVYAHAYWTRIAGVLRDDYPKLVELLGRDAFDALVVPYLRAYPTRDPSLREAGASLAAFLDDPCHADLAKLERARVEVFDSADATPLGRDDVAALAPEQFPALRLALVPASRIVELSTTADDVWDAIEAGHPPPVAFPASRAVLVWRRDLEIIHRTLQPDEAGPIRRMAGGATFADICETLAGDASAVERALALLLRWLDASCVVRI